MSKHAASASDRIRSLFASRGRPARDSVADVVDPFAMSSASDADEQVADLLAGPTPPRRRWTPRTMRAAVLGLAAVVAVIGWWWWQGQPKQVSAAPASAPTVLSSASPSVAEVVVHVVGDVVHPGLVRLPKGSRVDDAITAAGGVRKGGRLGPVNLARTVVDGEQIVVGRDAVAATGGANADGTVNLNSATAGDLEALPGIGPVLAQRIVTWRDANGPFTSVEQLREVSGIGDSTYADLSPLVRV